MADRVPIHLAVALDGAGFHPAAWRSRDASPGALFTGSYWTALAREAERGLLDFVSVEDTLAIQSEHRGQHDSRTDRVRGRLDAILVAARVAPLTRSIGLVPVATTTHTEPFHVSKAIATLDYVSAGRAGVQVRVSGTTLEAAQFGRRAIAANGTLDEATREELFDEAADFVEVLRRLWDSWEDDAEIRDVSTGRFIDRERLHYIDFVGRSFSVRGPSITPRPPQGQPVVAALAHAAVPFRLAARSADVVFITPRDVGHASEIIAAIRDQERATERTDPPLRIFADLVVLLEHDAGAARHRLEELDALDGAPYEPDARVIAGSAAELAELVIALQEAGVFGVRLRPAVLPHDLSAIVDDLVPILQHAGRFRREYAEATLRERLGLARPENRYAIAAFGGSIARRWDQTPMTTTGREIHLAAHFPGVNNTTVWSDPAAGSHIDFSSFVHLAQTAERAKFDFFFLAEGLRLREQRGRIHDLDVVGRPDTFTVLAALAVVTEHLGLSGTINSTFNEPFEVARQFASLDHLSGGRSAWNVVTSWDAFTGENFRRGGFLPESERYARAKEFLDTARELWDSWQGDEILADQTSGNFLSRPYPGRFEHHGDQFDIVGQFTVPRSPQGHPVIFQAGDSDAGREFAASAADAIFSRHGTLEDGQAFFADVKGRLARYGRSPDDLKILPAATFVLGDSEAEAIERAVEVRRQQVSGPTALLFLEHVWNRDLSDVDPDGPLPDFDPDLEAPSIIQGRANVVRDRMATATTWRELADAKQLSIRELVIEVTGRQSFVGTPATIAGEIDRLVQLEAADGFILVPHVTPGGLDEFADRVVPLLQERGHFRTEYEGSTLRDTLGLGPARRGEGSR